MHVPPNHWYSYTSVHGIITQKTTIGTLVALKTLHDLHDSLRGKNKGLCGRVSDTYDGIKHRNPHVYCSSIQNVSFSRLFSKNIIFMKYKNIFFLLLYVCAELVSVHCEGRKHIEWIWNQGLGEHLDQRDESWRGALHFTVFISYL
jgi:hypothetical protein